MRHGHQNGHSEQSDRVCVNPPLTSLFTIKMPSVGWSQSSKGAVVSPLSFVILAAKPQHFVMVTFLPSAAVKGAFEVRYKVVRDGFYTDNS